MKFWPFWGPCFLVFFPIPSPLTFKNVNNYETQKKGQDKLVGGKDRKTLCRLWGWTRRVLGFRVLGLFGVLECRVVLGFRVVQGLGLFRVLNILESQGERGGEGAQKKPKYHKG